MHVRCRAGDERAMCAVSAAGPARRAAASPRSGATVRSVYSVTRPGVDRRGFASPAPAASPRSLLTHTHKLRTLSTLTHEGGAPGHTHTACRLSIRYGLRGLVSTPLIRHYHAMRIKSTPRHRQSRSSWYQAVHSSRRLPDASSNEVLSSVQCSGMEPLTSSHSVTPGGMRGLKPW